MSGSGRETIPDVQKMWEALLDVCELSRDTPGSPKVVGGPPECPGVVGRTSRMSGSGRETLPDVPEWWEALLDIR